MKNLAAFAVSIAMILCLTSAAEFYLRSTGLFTNYWERNGLKAPAGRRAEKLPRPWLRVRKANSQWTLKEAEFTQQGRTNAEGLTGALPPMEKTRGELRIIAVGDSFTEGIGDPESIGYPGRLERNLRALKPARPYTVMNAGNSGSDPVFGLELIRRRLLEYHPDLVLLSINDSDIDDLKRRGGMDRFTQDGQLRVVLPSWTPLFDASHLVRAFVLGWLHFSWELQSPAVDAASTRMAIAENVGAAAAAQDILRKQGAKLLVLIQPLWSEVRDRNLRPELLEIEKGLAAARVDFADLLPEFISEIPSPITSKYYWPRDGHFTPEGYSVYARAVEKELRGRGITPSP